MKCANCKKEFQSKNKYYTHIREKHTFFNTEKKNCTICKNEFNSCVSPSKTIIKCENCRDKYKYYSLNSIIVKNNKRFIIKEDGEIEICKECDNIVSKNSKCYFHNNFKKFKKINDSNIYISKKGEIYNKYGKELSKRIQNRYYVFNINQKQHYLHRILAQLFIKNPDNYKIVNHKDGNKLNYNLINLEWCTHSQNTKHSHDELDNKASRKVICISNNIEYNSIRKASKTTGLSVKTISNSCRNLYKEKKPLFRYKDIIEKVEINDNNEEYKIIPGFNNYEITKSGIIRNKLTKKNLIGYKTEYISVTLACINNKNKKEFIHRLVAKTYLENPNNYEIVNHKDSNKLNNNVDNLEWCSRNDNVKHAVENGLIKTKKVKQLDKDKNVLNTFNSIKDAAEYVKVHPSNISNVCNNKTKTSKGYHWEFC
jgi:hypothetical protein